MNNILAGSSTGSFKPQNLMAGAVGTHSHLTTAEVAFVQGEVVCFENNKITKLVEGNKSKVFGIMPHDVSTVGGKNPKTSIYIDGTFNIDKIQLNGVALADVEETLSRRGILLSKFGG